MNRQPQAKLIYKKLKQTHPDAAIELVYSSPLELLIATILSAQCTDIKVNQVTKILFSKFKRAEDYVDKPLSELEAIVKPTGFFRQKAKNIRATVKKIRDEHGGKVPQSMEELTKLPGVGRKTANVVLGNAFGLPGLPVDTHVRRIGQRLGLTTNEDPVKIEHDLGKLIPPKDWCHFSHVLIFHGRRICKARKPVCEKCPVQEICNYRLSPTHV